MTKADQDGQHSEVLWNSVPHARLAFDKNNPRFSAESLDTDIDIIHELYVHADVDELIQSILSAGYIDFEPMVVLEGENIVLEGNRRLAALRLIADKQLRDQLGIKLPSIEPSVQLPEQIRVVTVSSRKQARNFIGFKHINGPFKWDSLAKAKYAAAWFEDGGDIASISKTLGDNHNTVRRIVSGWYVLQQAINNGFRQDDISKPPLAFSHLYTALSRPAVREYVEIESESYDSPKPNPVPNSKRDELAKLMSWLYGQESKDEPTVIKSQNPSVGQLSRVLEDPEATFMLETTRSLEAAHDRLIPQLERFEQALVRMSSSGEEVAKLVSHYEGTPTLLRIAENTERSLLAVLLVMRKAATDRAESQS